MVVGAVLLALGWIGHGRLGKAPVAGSSAGGASVAGTAPDHPRINNIPPSAPRPPVIPPNNGPQLLAARDAALKANPELAAESRQLTHELQAEQARFDADMIKADPKVAAIVAKMDEMRQRSRESTPAKAHAGAASAREGQVVITAEEWQELHAARAAMVQAHPDLIADNGKLMDKMRAFEGKLDAAMVKTDPAIAPVLAQFEAGGPPPGAPAAPTPAR